MIEARILVKSRKEGKQEKFTLNQLERSSVVEKFDLVEKAELRNMFWNTYELDRDHVAYVFIPADYFGSEEVENE